MSGTARGPGCAPYAPGTVTLTEREFGDQVLELAATFGWRTAHFRPARTTHGWRTPVQGDGKGFPDLVLVPPLDAIIDDRTRVLWRELKTDRGKLTDDQVAWGEALRAAGCDWAVWRPADMGSIVDQLSHGRAVGR